MSGRLARLPLSFYLGLVGAGVPLTLEVESIRTTESVQYGFWRNRTSHLEGLSADHLTSEYRHGKIILKLLYVVVASGSDFKYLIHSLGEPKATAHPPKVSYVRSML